nr:hypothetical protein [Mycobacterium leprae]
MPSVFSCANFRWTSVLAVSTGRLFAGNIGAGNRYEYTVIGDAVNEAARLADLAQTADHRILIFVR